MAINRLKIMCIQRGVRMDHLAKRFGITKSALSHYGAGRRAFPPDLLQKVADYLGCKPDDLLPDDEDDPVHHLVYHSKRTTGDWGNKVAQ